MFKFGKVEEYGCRKLIDIALQEDLGGQGNPLGDTTSRLTIPATLQGLGAMVARQSGVLSGIHAAAMVFRQVDPKLQFEVLCSDGATLAPGQHIAHVAGTVRSIFAGERTALNFVQHLSGIATLTSRYVAAVAGLQAEILDTRKTVPGERAIAKHAVRCGGGHNHRMGLSDWCLIKDNHLAALRDCAHPITTAISRVRAGPIAGITVEIEVDSLKQFDEALVARPDIILLDNMTLDQMREAVARRNADAPDVLLEASGGVNLQTVRAIAETGVDRISVGALTHSAPALDIGLDYESV
jgi:nicotinate-nucleotide pyrophosphorylase (carboxylating)